MYGAEPVWVLRPLVDTFDAIGTSFADHVHCHSRNIEFKLHLSIDQSIHASQHYFHHISITALVNLPYGFNSIGWGVCISSGRILGEILSRLSSILSFSKDFEVDKSS